MTEDLSSTQPHRELAVVHDRVQVAVEVTGAVGGRGVVGAAVELDEESVAPVPHVSIPGAVP